MRKKKSIVTIGGGTGTFVVLSGLKKHADAVAITAIVSVADSGGSTGRLRDEFGQLPIGDARQALAALAEEGNGENLVRDLFLFRFAKDGSINGHNFGNLFLVAMTELLGSEGAAISSASKILRVSGRVIPVSKNSATLVAEYEGEEKLHGEHKIDEPPEGHDGKLRITKLSLEPHRILCDEARHAVEEADLIVLGPGDLYTSTLASILARGMPKVIQKSKGKLVYVVNLFTRYGQTWKFTAQDHVDEITRYVGRKPDYVLMNSAPLPKKMVEYYRKKDREYPVIDDLGELPHLLRKDLLATKTIQKQRGDTLKRSLLRHDPEKLAQELITLI